MTEFLKTFTSGLANGLAGAATGGISQIVSGGIEGLGKLFGLGGMSQEEAMKKQQEYNKEIMALQNEYQVKAAEQSQQYAKDYWDYTNTENQVKHIKKAGLNVGLMYGQGGGGGMGLSGGAKQESPSQPQGNPVAMGLQVQALEQQKRMQDAEIAKTLAEAKKADIEADKTAGVDTKKTLAEINERLALIEKHNSERDLNQAKKELTDTENEIAKLTKEIKEWDRDYAGATKAAELAEMWATARNYSNQANYWYSMHEKVDTETQFQKDSMDTRLNILVEELALLEIEKRLKESAIEVNESQTELNKKHADELVELAKKHKSDAAAFVKEVNGQVQRWADQTSNENWELTLKSISVGLDVGAKIMEVFYPKVKVRKKQVTNKKGEVVREELEIIEDQTKK